ncbi:Maf family protein [Parapedobacter lycopersici]|uniref:Maf family protein n=1 Tax=Parapedobacter lycopersici TaxID=1864939 RepID=UPI00333F69A4
MMMSTEQSRIPYLNHKIILASKSPRRIALLKQLGITFEVAAYEVDESFPANLHAAAAVRFIAEKKARAFTGTIEADQLLVAADTVVVHDGCIMGKPTSEAHASKLLERLSGTAHEVITAVAIRQPNDAIYLFHEITEVQFRELTAEEIAYYLRHYQPYDKAGSYGIQEWIGLAAVERINGPYTNVVGLPTAALCVALQQLTTR